ncbi:MAG: LPS export ABC transporter periplasmic protein LptC [Pseudomonadota bacterium]|nr:LPS export ABC transporter periplasmic protein LptC [Pseudomonadota bacterium]
MSGKEKLILLALFLVVAAFSFWLQFGLLDKPEETISEAEKNDPDYYIENFVSVGMGEDGKRYRLEADRLVHFPVDDKALLNRPHLIQYIEATGPKHVYADSGWLYANGSEILLTGNVKVIQSQGGKPGGAGTSRKMRIKLKEKKASQG